MNKKLFIGVALIVLCLLGFFVAIRFPDWLIRYRVLNISYLDASDNKNVFTFKNGSFYYSYVDGKAGNQIEQYPDSSFSITMHKKQIALGDLNADTIKDVAVVTGTQYGGSGYFVDIKAFLRDNEGDFSYVGKIDLEDRAIVKDIGIADGVITVKALTHDSGEPLCCAKTPAIFTLGVNDNQLHLISKKIDLSTTTAAALSN